MTKGNSLLYVVGFGITILFALIVIMIFKTAPTKTVLHQNITYLHDVYQFQKATQEDINKYFVRLDINKKIQELGVSRVVSFFNQYTHNSVVSITIIQEAIKHQIPVNIAFSLAWRESRFDIDIVSSKNHNGSRDWGLFQLNDTYYKWSHKDFFNIKKNTRAGLAHLEYCLDKTGNLQMALAAYNAGVNGVNNGIPKTTKKYVNIIFEHENQINEEFNKWLKTL